MPSIGFVRLFFSPVAAGWRPPSPWAGSFNSIRPLNRANSSTRSPFVVRSIRSRSPSQSATIEKVDPPRFATFNVCLFGGHVAFYGTKRRSSRLFCKNRPPNDCEKKQVLVWRRDLLVAKLVEINGGEDRVNSALRSSRGEQRVGERSMKREEEKGREEVTNWQGKRRKTGRG